MSFLISGFPRCRSAWFTALLNAHGLRTYHDVYVYEQPTDGTVNVSDPAVAMRDPRAAQNFDTVICLYRDPYEAKQAIETWGHFVYDEEKWDEAIQNIGTFMVFSHAMYHIEDLDSDANVAEIVRLCGAQPDMELIAVFQRLKIEEHLGKAVEHMKT